jgi:hypothetical protein
MRNGGTVLQLSVNLLTGQSIVVHSPGEGATTGPLSTRGKLITDRMLYLGDTLPECQIVDDSDAACR